MSKLKIKSIDHEQLQLLLNNLKEFIGDTLTKSKIDHLFPNKILKDKYCCSFRNLYPIEQEVTLLTMVSFHYRLKKLRPILEIRPGLKLIIQDDWNHKFIRKHLKLAIKQYEYPKTKGSRSIHGEEVSDTCKD